jgi:hypothetical protein
MVVIGCASDRGAGVKSTPIGTNGSGAASAGAGSPGTDWPLTCDEAITRIVRELDPKSKKLVRTTPYEDLIGFHHGWGMGIRNRFGLWAGNKSLFDSCMERATWEQRHPDTVSMIIIEGVWEELQKEGKTAPK